MGKFYSYCPRCMSPAVDLKSCPVCGFTKDGYKTSPQHLPIGTVLEERYLVGCVLGEGGFGITYIGRDLKLDRKVAIKEYFPSDRATRNHAASLEISSFVGASALAYERGKQKYLSEAQAMAQMNKQQVIVNVHDFFEANNTAYIIMEYVEGITFYELVEKRGGRISPKELFPMIEPLFHALSAMHKCGLIHRDISPDNLMLENDRIRLLDFGCTREASHGTETLTIALKHGYAPMEQYQQKGQGPWTDIYSLCATIYYCLTGIAPPQALDRIGEDELVPLSSLGVTITKKQEKALLKGMCLQPKRRFLDVKELWEALYAVPAQNVEWKDDDDRYLEIKKSENRVALGSERDWQEEAVLDLEEKDWQEKAVLDSEVGDWQEQAVLDSERKDLQDETALDSIIRGSKEEAVQNSEIRESKNGSALNMGIKKPKDGVGSRFQEDRKKKSSLLYFAAGAAAAYITILAVIGMGRAYYPYSQKGYNDGAGNASAADSISKDIKEGNEKAASMWNAAVFDQAYLFSDGTAEDFRELMEDDSVPAVILDSSFSTITQLSITKPVLLKEGFQLQADHLAISGNGCLRVEGELDLTKGGYIRLLGDNLRLFIAEEGVLLAEDALLWMDAPGCFCTESKEQVSISKLVLTEDAFADAVSVSDEKALAKAARLKQAVRIDGDLILTEDISFTAPVQISEGVAVRSVYTQNDGIEFCLNEGAVLVNNGTLDSNIWASGNSTILNNGQMAGGRHDMGKGLSLWIEKGSVFVNFGTVDAYDCSRFWDSSMCLNMGTLNAYDVYLTGGNLVNFGDVLVAQTENEGERHLFKIRDGSRLWNKKQASVKVAAGAVLENNGFIYNREGGNILIQSGGEYGNALIENHGTFKAEFGARLRSEQHGVYYGEGEFDTGMSDVKVYHISNHISKAAYVSSEKELLAALDDSEVETVWVIEDFTVHTDLTVRKNIFVNASWKMAEGAGLLDYGGCIMLMMGASFTGSSLTLYEDAQICVQEGAELVVEAGGSLVLDSSLLWGNGRARLENINFTLRNRSGLALTGRGCFLDADQSEIMIQNHASLVTPHGGEFQLKGSVITMQDQDLEAASHFCCVSDIDFTDCILKFETGKFDGASDLAFHNCKILIGKDASFESLENDLSVLGGSVLENRGSCSIGGWDEHTMTVHGLFTNYGELYVWLANLDLSEPIDNQGKAFLGQEVDPACFTGRKPVIQE